MLGKFLKAIGIQNKEEKRIEEDCNYYEESQKKHQDFYIFNENKDFANLGYLNHLDIDQGVPLSTLKSLKFRI